jgi:hypothetical protein
MGPIEKNFETFGPPHALYGRCNILLNRLRICKTSGMKP